VLIEGDMMKVTFDGNPLVTSCTLPYNIFILKKCLKLDKSQLKMSLQPEKINQIKQIIHNRFSEV
jgi:hypothetical protein